MNDCARTPPSMHARVGGPRTELKSLDPSGHPDWLCLCLMLGILSSSTLSHGAGKAGAASIPLELRDDVYAIYELALNTARQQNHPGSESKTITVDGKTGGRQGALSLLKCHTPVPAKKAIYAELFRDFRRVIQHRWVLERRFQLIEPYVLAVMNDLPWGDESDAHASRQLNSKDVPKNQSTIETICTLSSVGFNKDRSRALVYTSCSCGPLCGEDSLNILAKNNGRWEYDDAYDGTVCMTIS